VCKVKVRANPKRPLGDYCLRCRPIIEKDVGGLVE